MHVGIDRHFLGWNAPVVQRAAEFLVERFSGSGIADLSNVVIVVPGGRAGRQFTAALVDHAHRSRVPLLLPRVVTVGGFLQETLRPRVLPAEETERVWAWTRSLQAMSEDVRRAIAARLPPTSDVRAWASLARAIDRGQQELAGEGLSFADVARESSGLPDSARWSALAELEQAFRARLKASGLVDVGFARLEQLGEGSTITSSNVVLFGLSELPAVARRALSATAQASTVLSLIIAPENLRDRFDEFGCVRFEAWSNADLEQDAGLKSSHVRVVHTPLDQADAALEVLESWTDLSIDEVLIGELDEEVSAHLTTRGPMCGVEVRSASGRRLAGTSAYKLVAALAEYVESWSFRGLGSLVRHPAISRQLAQRLEVPEGSWLATLDDFAIEHLPDTTRTIAPEHQEIRHIVARVDDLLGPLASTRPSREQPLSAWCDDLAHTLSSLRPHEFPRVDDQGFEELVDVLVELASARNTIDVPRCGTHQALAYVLDACEGVHRPDPYRPDAVEMLGWLELLCDDSRAIMLTGFNEGNVPARTRASLLTNSVRATLRLPPSDSHAARDRYMLAALSASGKRLAIIAGRTTNDGDPLLPSRLLFACADDEVARRVARWRHQDAGEIRRPPTDGVATPSQNAFRVLVPDPTHRPADSAAIERMSVTSFRDYLASPYLYYLRHVLGLSEVENPTRELDVLAFGSLIHECLHAFGKSDVRTSTRADDINQFLSETLDKVILSRFGARTPVGVLVQREHARGRLRACAHWQANHAARGWAIDQVEWSPDEGHPSAGVAFEVDGKMVRLHGRIDRIDRHADGRLLLLDYKTAKAPKSPEQTHLSGPKSNRRWVDLQLPLYRLLARCLGGLGAQMGYVCLPMKPSETDLKIADWSNDQLADAEECARDVVRAIRRGEFFASGDRPPTEGVLGWLAGTSFVSAEGDEHDAEGGD